MLHQSKRKRERQSRRNRIEEETERRKNGEEKDRGPLIPVRCMVKWPSTP